VLRTEKAETRRSLRVQSGLFADEGERRKPSVTSRNGSHNYRVCRHQSLDYKRGSSDGCDACVTQHLRCCYRRDWVSVTKQHFAAFIISRRFSAQPPQQLHIDNQRFT
jgi:hypothetical protein